MGPTRGGLCSCLPRTPHPHDAPSPCPALPSPIAHAAAHTRHMRRPLPACTTSARRRTHMCGLLGTGPCRPEQAAEQANAETDSYTVSPNAEGCCWRGMAQKGTAEDVTGSACSGPGGRRQTGGHARRVACAARGAKGAQSKVVAELMMTGKWDGRMGEGERLSLCLCVGARPRERNYRSHHGGQQPRP